MDKSFYRCEKCGKKIIVRLPNGLFHFAFGSIRLEDGTFLNDCPRVELYIFGSVRIKCISKVCNHWNVFNFFPNIPVDCGANDNPK